MNAQLFKRVAIFAIAWKARTRAEGTSDTWNLAIRQFPVAVERSGELVKGPYVAETFPVSVAQQYVVEEA